jgi:hypothetical protein
VSATSVLPPAIGENLLYDPKRQHGRHEGCQAGAVFARFSIEPYLFVRQACCSVAAACTRSCSSNNKAVPDCGSDSELGGYLQPDLQQTPLDLSKRHRSGILSCCVRMQLLLRVTTCAPKQTRHSTAIVSSSRRQETSSLRRG